MKKLHHERFSPQPSTWNLFTDTVATSTASEERIVAAEYKRIYEAIEHATRRFETHAHALNKRRWTRNTQMYWQTRGRQELLQKVSNHLQRLCAQYQAPCELALAFRDYLGCLEKYAVDIEDEEHMSAGRNTWPVNQWKAQGAAGELEAIFAHLTSVLYLHIPLRPKHLLSFDGKHLIPLDGESDERVVARAAHTEN